MRLVTFEQGGHSAVGILDGGLVRRVATPSMLALIETAEDVRSRLLEAATASDPIRPGRLLAPLPRPGKLLFSGVNYRSHKDENPDGVLPTKPSFFSKLPSSVIGPGDEIRIPREDAQTDYEVELAVVMGRTASHVSREDALDHVFGYTITNDLSERFVQMTEGQITLGKGFDTFCPMGPSIVLKDEIPDPSRLTVSSYVNGERRQFASTDQFLFDVPTYIEYISRWVTLEPGDVLGTGTPAGVGYFVKPFGAGFLKPGDVVDVEVDGIGRISNPVIAGW
jgi:2-keto-4-pentenoate hydratase/2-oxohepta-3-ene-1,7-dioic acid hydratase in catechol pathway